MTATATLESIVGAAHVCSPEVGVLSFDQVVKAPEQIQAIVSPGTPAELEAVMQYAHAEQLKLLVYGSGSKLHWGGIGDSVDLVVSTARLNQLIDHAAGDLTVTIEAGMKFADLQAILAKQNQFLPIDPNYLDRATLGGIVATANAGSLRHRYGGIRDLLIGISFVRHDGQSAKAGGRVVKNVAGYDLMKLFTGSYGSLGVLSQLTLRIYPIPPASETVMLTGDANAIAKAGQTLLASALSPVAIDLLPASVLKALDLGGAIGLAIRFQSIEISVAQQSQQAQQIGEAIGLMTAIFSGEAETHLWQSLQQFMDGSPASAAATCKIGVLPNQAVSMLMQLCQLDPNLTGAIHSGSGLGMLHFNAAADLLKARHLCQSQGGFLSLLAAPLALKQQIEVWGYAGNAFEIMTRLKQQFDPDRRLSPGRFVGGL